VEHHDAVHFDKSFSSNIGKEEKKRRGRGENQDHKPELLVFPSVSGKEKVGPGKGKKGEGKGQNGGVVVGAPIFKKKMGGQRGEGEKGRGKEDAAVN